MQIIDSANAPAGDPEIGRRMGLEVTAAQLANMLESGRNVEQIAHIRRPRIGYRAIRKSNRHSDPRLVRIELESLPEIESLKGCPSVVKGGKAVSILLVPSRDRVLLRINAGEIFAFNCTALVRVLLAAAGSARAEYPLMRARVIKLLSTVKQTFGRVWMSCPMFVGKGFSRTRSGRYRFTIIQRSFRSGRCLRRRDDNADLAPGLLLTC